MKMSNHALGLLIGGFIPALLFAAANLLIKGGSEAGGSLSLFLIFYSLGTLVVAGVAYFLTPDFSVTTKAVLLSFATGACAAAGTAAISYAVLKYGASMSVLIPVFNLNTLLGVVIGLWIFAEWKNVKIPDLLIGTVLIVVGTFFVSKA